MILLALWLMTSPPVDAPELQFRDVAAEWGLAGVVGTTGDASYPDLRYVNGCGIAVGDVNADGRPDMYVVQGGAPNLLFLNRGDRFEEVGEAFGVADHGQGAGALFVDLTGDGYPELLLTNFGEDRAWTNVNGERFEPLEGFGDAGMGMSVAVGDFDADRVPDIYVSRYVEWPETVPTKGGACQFKGLPVICGPEAYRPQGDIAYRFVEGRFERREGFAVSAPGRGMGVAAFDPDGDGNADLYVANDASDNFLFLDGTERALELGTALSAQGRPEAGMGVSIGDVDGDLRDDIVVTNFDGQTHSLYMANEGGWYDERSAKLGLGSTTLRRLSWGAQLADFDFDGDLDLHVVNGHLYANADEIGDGTSWKQPDDLFVNDGFGHFTPMAEGWDGVDAESGRSSALLDFDADGRLDIAVWNLGGPLRLLRNETAIERETKRYRLVAEEPGAPAALLAGSVIEIVDGAVTRTRTLRVESGYLGGNEWIVVATADAELRVLRSPIPAKLTAID